MKRAPKKFFPEKLATGGRKNKCNDKSKAIQAKMQSEQHLSRRQRALCHWKKGTFENLGGLGLPAPPPRFLRPWWYNDWPAGFYCSNSLNQPIWYTAISIKVVHEQSGKVEYERERLLGIPKNLMNFHSDIFPAAFRARIQLFRFARGQP
jgi:hypothetical protein